MPLLVLNAKIENAKVIKGMRGKWAKAKKAAMEATARHWMEAVFPRHFASGNQSKYQHEKRNKFYKSVIKRLEGQGEGKTVDLQLQGKSMRWMKATARVTSTSNRATLRMSAPAYFTNPKIGRVQKVITDKKTGRERTININITRQPDKVAELRRFNETDRRTLQRFLESDLALRVNLAIRGV